MKKVNTYFKYLLLLVITLLYNCSLDENLYGVATTDKFVETKSDADFVINGVYATFQSFNSFKSSTAGLVLYSGDDFTCNNISQTNAAGVWLNRLFTSSNIYVRYAWNSFYDLINRANSASEAILPVTSLDYNYRIQVDGEMKFLRGFSYYYLVRLFGEVPIWTVATTPAYSFYQPRQTVDSVYQQIFQDFKEANQKCIPYSAQPDREFGRATKGAAQAMLASAYLTYANYCDMNGKSDQAQLYYEEAVNWADSVILSNEYVLLDNYADLFDVEKEKNAYREVIFGIQFARDNTAASASSKGSEWAYYTQPRTRRNISGHSDSGIGYGNIKLQPWFAEQYYLGEYVGDYRTEVSFLTEWDGFDASGTPKKYVTFPLIVENSPTLVREPQPYLNKYRDPKGVDMRNHENDLFIIRFSEIYLIKAEALNELGNTLAAYAEFNKVRERARKANGAIRLTPVNLESGLSKEDFRLAVFNERGLELVGEGQRFFDCKRFRYLNTNKTMLQWRMETFYPELPATTKTLPRWNQGMQNWEEGRVYMLNVSEWNERFLLYPIPTAELDANSNFGSQNPGW